MRYGKYSFWNRFTSSPITLFIIIVVFVFLVKAVWGIKEKAVISQTKLDTAEMKLAKLEEHKQNLNNRINYLSTEQGIEAELRTKYGAVREGESVAVIVDDDQTAAVAGFASTSLVANKKRTSWLGKIFDFFGF